jgi:hypothetical protein
MARSIWSRLTGDDAPTRIENPPVTPDMSRLAGQFEAYEPNPAYAGVKLDPPSACKHYPQIHPRTIRDVEPLAPPLKAIVDSMWQRAEPAKGATRGPITMGLRGQSMPTGPMTQQESVYHPHVNPLKAGEPAFANDWHHMEWIVRTNAVTFRGDSRDPNWVIGRDGGFFPPSHRTDDYYLYGVVFNAFKDYMHRRYDRDVTMQHYVSAISGNAATPEAKQVLVNYMMWRKITEGEAFHLGRMVKDEALKGYISTSRAVPVAADFGTRHLATNGWIYITLVRGGYIVPPTGSKWGTHEQEIAQWGPILAHDIVGFQAIDSWTNPAGPIYVRPTFRKTEPKAFRRALDYLSHRPPSGFDG